MQASAMELFVNILNGLLFSQYMLHHRCYCNFQSQAKVEQIVAIVTTLSVSCFHLKQIIRHDFHIG